MIQINDDYHQIKESTSLENDTTTKKKNNDEIINSQNDPELLSLIGDDYKYSEEHFPRIKAELDRLNYANESINNLELEVEDTKREFLAAYRDFDLKLNKMEKNLGSCVKNAYPYYEFRIELNDLKKRYISSKNKFETSQELYVAAKNMKEYCEVSLEKYDASKEENLNQNVESDKDLVKMLNIALLKISETESSKQKNDLEQIQAQEKYGEKLKEFESIEKNLKSYVEKSRIYYELKFNSIKELKFLYNKIEGLKCCLKEAKNTYQRTLSNLEVISIEIHKSRNESNLFQSEIKSKECNSHENSIPGSTTIIKEANIDTYDLDLDNELNQHDKSLNKNEKNETSPLNKTSTQSFQFSHKKYGKFSISDEEIEILRFENLLRNFESELLKA